MFKSIYLGNFKAFAKSQKIPLKPLTLIFGPNSAGKSSLIHGLLFAHEAHTNDESDNLNVRRPRIGGDSVDLGGFRQFVHQRISDNQVEWGVEIDTSLLEGWLGELLKPVKGITITLQIGLSDFMERSRVTVQSYEINTGDKTLLRASMKKKGENLVMGLDELDDENPVIRTTVEAIIENRTTTQKIKEEDYDVIQKAINNLVEIETLILDMGNFLPNGILKPSKADHLYEQATLFPISQGNRKEDLANAVKFWLPRTIDDIIKGLGEYIGGHLKKLHYLGPLRSYPARHIAFTQDYDANWYAGGGYAWDLVRDDPEVRNKVNSWLSSPERMKTPYKIIVRNLYNEDDLEDPLWESLEQLEEEGLKEEVDAPQAPDPEVRTVIADMEKEIERFKKNLVKSRHDTIKDLILYDIDKKTIVSHRDVGIGVSQVLPVLVTAFSSNDAIVAMEQPELHLHPKLQAELGDVFIESAIERKNTFILETHSEHLILRLLRRIRETTDGELPEGLNPLTPDDISILYIKPSLHGSEIHEIPVTEDGEFKDKWPDGFFAERAEELF